MYNAALYEMRQTFFNEGIYLTYEELHHRMQSHEAYQALPAKVSQQILMLLATNWESFRKALASYHEDPSKFTGRPHIPRYKHKTEGRNILVYTIQAVSKRGLKKGLIQPSMLPIEVQTKHTAIHQVRIIPRNGHYVVEVVYSKEPVQAEVDPSCCVAIDLGVTNLAAITSNREGFIPRLVNGRTLKAMNQWYNKRMKELKLCLPKEDRERVTKQMEQITSKRIGVNPPMLTSPDIRLFSAEPDKTQAARKRALFGGLRVLGSAQNVFLRETLIIIDIVSLIFAFLIVSTLYAQHSSTATIIAVEAFFLASLVLLLIARKSVHFAAVLAFDSAILVLNVLLNVLFQGNWGNFGLLALCGYTCYRLPLRWAWSIVAASCIALATTNGLNELILTRHLSSGSPLVTSLLLVAFLCWTGWTRRSRDLLVLELQETQEQLRREMAHTEELAVTRERARIARDIHDVLAHSLTVLSIQVQAARQLVQQHPERLAAKLDDIATLLRESIAESRHVVGLLRETATPSRPHGDVGKRLQAVVDRFCERTGIHCAFEEEGTPQRTSNEQAETLQYALQEALTNAHRHGSAQHVWVDLRWHDARVILQVRDDGQGQGSIEQYNGTHHGLQGMRERVTTLGGELQAGSQPDRGFAVTLSLPLGGADRSRSQEGKRERT